MNLWQAAEKPILALAPMADMTDSAFCRVAKRLGAPIVVREMVSAEAVVRGNDKTLAMAAFTDEERPIVQQVFGADPAVMAEAVRRIDAAHSPDGFDVNMGCPANKITSNFNGAALMREPETAAAIVRAMKTATAKPVSVKTRLGWSRPDEIVEFVKVLEEAGADLVAIHGRTKEQGYSGTADWAAVGAARRGVKIPVLVNGDIRTGEDLKRALDLSGADGALIGRGALGNPWVFAQLRGYLDGRPVTEPTDEERRAVILEHARLHLELHGELVSFRKQLLWYFKGRPGARALREQLSHVSALEEIEAAVEAATENRGLDSGSSPE
jgi:nifR3 family TIM-barrel protein